MKLNQSLKAEDLFDNYHISNIYFFAATVAGIAVLEQSSFPPNDPPNLL